MYGFSTDILKEKILLSLSIIINKCFKEGKFLTLLKIAKICPKQHQWLQQLQYYNDTRSNVKSGDEKRNSEIHVI